VAAGAAGSQLRWLLCRLLHDEVPGRAGRVDPQSFSALEISYGRFDGYNYGYPLVI
jgi:hypothetical protein